WIMVFLPGAPIGLPLPYSTALLSSARSAQSDAGRAGAHDLPLAARNAGPDQRDQVAPELDRVPQRVEAPDQHGVSAGIVVVEQRFGDLRRGAAQRRRAAGRAGGGRDCGPEPLVVHLAARRELEQPLRADVLRPRRGIRAAA